MDRALAHRRLCCLRARAPKFRTRRCYNFIYTSAQSYTSWYPRTYAPSFLI
jgi:hypothetical protein